MCTSVQHNVAALELQSMLSEQHGEIRKRILLFPILRYSGHVLRDTWGQYISCELQILTANQILENRGDSEAFCQCYRCSSISDGGYIPINPW